MGYTVHHAIVVTGFDKELMGKLREEADAAGLRPTPLTPSGVNFCVSFLIPPDGSKEGWPASNDGDERRAKFKTLLRGSTCEWVEVQYSNEQGDARVSDSAWPERREEHPDVLLGRSIAGKWRRFERTEDTNTTSFAVFQAWEQGIDVLELDGFPHHIGVESDAAEHLDTLVSTFEAAGHRGVVLADEIDSLRRALLDEETVEAE
jgi:hypothetical protein